ncbi:SH3 and cysteine-rich domain-containing protein isoform X5 [Pseudorca crassidens]|uniref:SH3 and cysteine-rich domain-containing protein isoform X5 n=1 Tax=Pseudorca crassidens TaxID=82174 RepID=UPI00352F1B80
MHHGIIRQKEGERGVWGERWWPRLLPSLSFYCLPHDGPVNRETRRVCLVVTDFWCWKIQLQKLKRSLSFKTKSLRSKSADNFFQRTNSDAKLQADMLSEVSPSSSLLPAPGCLTSTVTRAGLYPGGGKAHAFQEHIFKKPTFCDVCNHMIVGTNAKHGLRCKACKMSVHHKCMDGLAPQRCMGKLPKGFRRYYSSPLLIHEQFGCIKEVMPIACGNKVDPVYETLRFGTSLAQRTKKGSSGSGSSSPPGTSISDLVEVPEEADGPAGVYGLRKRSNSVFTYPENGTDDFRDQAKNINHQGPLSKDQLQMNTYVALYKFIPQENEDLEMRPGDMITLLEDSNEDWWKICVTSEEEQDGFIRVLSGKKRGLVPFDVLEDI